MKEAELKTDIGTMAPLIIGGILLWAFVLRPNAKKAGKAGNERPPTNSAEPAVEIGELAFEGSPAERVITKKPGEYFMAQVTLKNPTIAEWRYDIELRFGELALIPAWTTEATMPILMSSVDVPPGATVLRGISHTVPANAKTKTYDIRVEVQVAGKGIPGGLADYEDRFTVPAPVVEPQVAILELAWV